MRVWTNQKPVWNLWILLNFDVNTVLSHQWTEKTFFFAKKSIKNKIKIIFILMWINSRKFSPSDIDIEELNVIKGSKISEKVIFFAEEWKE